MYQLIIYFLESALDYERDRDNGGGFYSTLTIGACILLYWFFGSSEDIRNLLRYLRDHSGASLIWVGSYIVIGLVWSIFKDNKAFCIFSKVTVGTGADGATYGVGFGSSTFSGALLYFMVPMI